jgi:hypothetical protein
MHLCQLPSPDCGPGHTARSPLDSSNPSLSLQVSAHIAFPTTSFSPSMAALHSTPPLYTIFSANHQFSFPPPAHVSAPSYDDSLDYSACYRAHADFLTRAGVIPQERAPPLPPSTKNPQPPTIRVMLRAMRNPTICTTTIKMTPCHRLQSGVDYGYNIDNKVHFICISSFSRSSIDLQSPSPSHSRTTSSVIPPTSTTLIIRRRSIMTLKFTNAVSRVTVIRATSNQTSSATSSSVHLPLAADYLQ